MVLAIKDTKNNCFKNFFGIGNHQINTIAAIVNLKPISNNGGKYSKAGLAITKPNPKKIGTTAAKSVSLRLKFYFIGIRFLGSKKGSGTTFAFKFA